MDSSPVLSLLSYPSNHPLSICFQFALNVFPVLHCYVLPSSSHETPYHVSVSAKLSIIKRMRYNTPTSHSPECQVPSFEYRVSSKSISTGFDSDAVTSISIVSVLLFSYVKSSKIVHLRNERAVNLPSGRFRRHMASDSFSRIRDVRLKTNQNLCFEPKFSDSISRCGL